ncbi:MAG TPA: hypothetical protein VF097_00730 [Actinomycetota bacterium]
MSAIKSKAHAAAPLTTCPGCGSSEVVVVTFGVGDSPIVFRTCPPCEAKWWEQDGDLIDRETAIPLVTAA